VSGDPIKPARPPGEWWDWRTKSVKRDRLRELEDWAERHPAQMTPDRWDKLTALKAEYERIECEMLRFAEWYAGFGPEYVWGYHDRTTRFLPTVVGADYQTMQEVLHRLVRAKKAFCQRSGHSRFYSIYKKPPKGDNLAKKDGGGTGRDVVSDAESTLHIREQSHPQRKWRDRQR